jgi:hypothetical protein
MPHLMRHLAGGGISLEAKAGKIAGQARNDNKAK